MFCSQIESLRDIKLYLIQAYKEFYNKTRQEGSKIYFLICLKEDIEKNEIYYMYLLILFKSMHIFMPLIAKNICSAYI